MSTAAKPELGLNFRRPTTVRMMIMQSTDKAEEGGVRR